DIVSPRRRTGGHAPGHLVPLLLPVVVLDLGELRVHDVVPGRGTAATRGTFAAGVLLLRGGGHGREQGLAGFLELLRLGLDLGLVVALHRGLELGDRGLGVADDVAADLVAVVLDRGAGGVDPGGGLVAGLDQLLGPAGLPAGRPGAPDPARA